MENLPVVPLLIATLVGFLAATVLMSIMFISRSEDQDARLDSRRLDFLQEQNFGVYLHLGSRRSTFWFIADKNSDAVSSNCVDIREAIDEAHESWRVQQVLKSNITKKDDAS